MSYVLWIAGSILGLAWLSRVVDAALGICPISLTWLDRSGTGARLPIRA